jgi:hypothetical protein
MEETVSTSRNHAIGYLVLALLILGIGLWFVPWAFYSIIFQVFGVSVEHTFVNYFYFWVLKLFVFGTANFRRE